MASDKGSGQVLAFLACVDVVSGVLKMQEQRDQAGDSAGRSPGVCSSRGTTAFGSREGTSR